VSEWKGLIIKSFVAIDGHYNKVLVDLHRVMAPEHRIHVKQSGFSSTCYRSVISNQQLQFCGLYRTVCPFHQASNQVSTNPLSVQKARELYQEQVESSCEFGIEPSGSMKCWETIEWPNI
jgi:hypothetical protein